MLVITRNGGEWAHLYLDDKLLCRLSVDPRNGGQVRLIFDAPDYITIRRAELGPAGDPASAAEIAAAQKLAQLGPIKATLP